MRIYVFLALLAVALGKGEKCFAPMICNNVPTWARISTAGEDGTCGNQIKHLEEKANHLERSIDEIMFERLEYLNNLKSTTMPVTVDNIKETSTQSVDPDAKLTTQVIDTTTSKPVTTRGIETTFGASTPGLTTSVATTTDAAFMPSTCHEMQQHDPSATSGFYTLYHAANLMDTFQVYCHISSSKAITEIRHNEMDEIEATQSPTCGGAGCYSWTPTYSLTRQQIIGIIEKSSQCRQFIKARCVETYLLNSGYAWWVSRDGEKMNYWGGATSRRDGYCACGEIGNCISRSLSGKCNCDTNSGTQGTDEGFLTDKTKLPAKELRFGDLDQSDEFVWHTLGKLECWGAA